MRQLFHLPPSLLALLAALALPETICGEAISRLALPPDYVDARLANLTGLEQQAHHEVVAQKQAAIEARLATQTPIGMRAMSGDPSEKFFPEYWIFDDEEGRPRRSDSFRASKRRDTWQEGVRRRSTSQGTKDASSNSTLGALYAPLLLHYNGLGQPLSPRALHKRGYQCPSEYHSCSNIGDPGTCCSTGQTCQIIRDTGVGTVGCCPTGQDCSGSVGSCDALQGYTSCPTYQNKNGCCSPGFTCDNVGCIEGGKAPDTSQSTSAEVVAASVTTSTKVETQVIVPAGPSTVYITTITPTATVIVSAYGLSTAITTVTTTIVSGGGVLPPVRQTSEPVSAMASMCPQNYYRCSAYYLGGCCSVGRDCDSSDCPSMASTQIVGNGVVTVIVATGEGIVTVSQGSGSLLSTLGTGTAITVAAVPTTATVVVGASGGGGGGGAAVAGAQGCPQSWFNCGGNGGGGCCPSGYACAATCTATVAGLPTAVAKVFPSSATTVQTLGTWMVLLAGALGMGMVLL